MILIIMRHGEAESFQANDQKRALTAFGVEQSTKITADLRQFLSAKGLLPGIDKVLVSPYLRTQQTYEAASQNLDIKVKLVTDAITPLGDVTTVHDIIDGYAMSDQNGADKKENLMLISHMPLVSLLADSLCPGFNGKIFDTADILVIDYDHKSQTGEQLTLLESRK